MVLQQARPPLQLPGQVSTACASARAKAESPVSGLTHRSPTQPQTTPPGRQREAPARVLPGLGLSCPEPRWRGCRVSQQLLCGQLITQQLVATSVPARWVLSGLSFNPRPAWPLSPPTASVFSLPLPRGPAPHTLCSPDKASPAGPL